MIDSWGSGCLFGTVFASLLGANRLFVQNLVRQFTGRGVRIEFIKEGLTCTGEDSPMANLLLSVMGAFAEFERELIRERITCGAYRGRKPVLSST